MKMMWKDLVSVPWPQRNREKADVSSTSKRNEDLLQTSSHVAMIERLESRELQPMIAFPLSRSPTPNTMPCSKV